MPAFVIDFPESLPVSTRRDEITAAIRQNQVIIVCGETGSGKTTQLPKILLAMGRGKMNYAPGQRAKLIGHTQPRRIAASSVAKRIADELKTPLGEVVGYKVRFQDKLSRDASVKLMTDGILLAETQTDPLLNAYDTIIIDEAHERSLNIDFLLGYLKQILPRRPDLKIIVTSATIDADRFARHFASQGAAAPGRPKQGTAPHTSEAPGEPGTGGREPHEVGDRGGDMLPAPVILVSGRMFPVEQRYRPFEESRDYDLNDAIADAADELWRDAHGSGDILVFLPGEREIREAADHLRRHFSHQPMFRNAEVLPLFSRLTQAEQERIFDSHSGRRIVLATNVAETSLTVPGINYVIDAGTARIKRYSFRSKVEQLLVEPISQSSANQRAGRCGRVADGICIRLYDQKDFDGRPKFTDPEILRSSLAGVILRMKSLHLGQVEDFPFLERPQGRAIADGYQLLNELGAVDDANELTPTGAELAKLPLDPRVGRMILEARSRSALDEVLVIASALSVQDVRDRPLEMQAQADQAHAKFDDEKSEFSGYLRLWKWLNELPGTNRQKEQQLRASFVNPRRVREWRDIHSQLHTVITELGWLRPAPGRPKPGTAPVGGRALHEVSNRGGQPASYEHLHQALLAGMLGNVGFKLEAQAGEKGPQGEYLGARGIKFFAHPGAHLAKKPGRWIVASELVETTRLFGRGIANIDPTWLETVGAHLLKKQLLDPHWEKKAGEVMALERATLYGLVVYSGRRVNYGRVDPHAAREIFIRQALVEGQWETPLAFLAANQKLVKQVEELEHKARRQDVLVDDELIFAYYDQQIPQDVCSGHSFERWYKHEAHAKPHLLKLTREELMRHEAAGITTDSFPKTVRLGGVDCAATYLHEPGDAKDGLTACVPLFVLNQVSEERCEWLVPGMLKEKVQALLKTLHQRPRSRLVPLPDTATQMAELLNTPETFGKGPLVEAILKLVRAKTALDVARADIKVDMLAPHFFMNLRVVDEHGRQLGTGRNLGALKAELGAQARGAFAALASLKMAENLSSSDVINKNEESSHVKHQQSASDSGENKPDKSTNNSSRTKIHEESVYASWTFGELPELLEIRKGGQSLIGYPALVEAAAVPGQTSGQISGQAPGQMSGVRIEVFDEPQVAATAHRSGLRRLFALQLKEPIKYIEKNLPDLQKMATAYMLVGRQTQKGDNAGGTLEELRTQIINVALERAFMLEPLPTDAAQFQRRLDEGRGRLTLIASEVARLAATVLAEYASAARKIKDSKSAVDAAADAAQQLHRLMPKRFLAETPWPQLPHVTRYLKAITLRLDKYRADPARDAARLAELRPLEQKYWRLAAERKGQLDDRMLEFRWLLEELRVSFFAQELRTPQPVSVKRLEKAWAQLNT